MEGKHPVEMRVYVYYICIIARPAWMLRSLTTLLSFEICFAKAFYTYIYWIYIFYESGYTTKSKLKQKYILLPSTVKQDVLGQTKHRGNESLALDRNVSRFTHDRLKREPTPLRILFGLYYIINIWYYLNSIE